MGEANVDDVLDMLGFGRMQLCIFFGCAAQQWYVANEQFGIALVIVAARCEFDIDEHRMVWLVNSAFAAQVCASHYLGYKSDEIGRRKMLLICSMMSILTSFISALMPDFWSFLVLRFIMGICLTGIVITQLTYMSEFTKISLRPKVINFACYAIGISMIYVPVSAMVLLPLRIHLKIWGNYGISSWRLLLMTNLPPGLIAWTIIYCMPESPKYYLSVDKPQKAFEVLDKCCRYNKGKDVTLRSLNIGSVSQPGLRSDTASADKNCLYRIWCETKPLLQGSNLCHMLLSISILFLLFGTGFGLIVWMPLVLQMTEQIAGNMILCDLVAESLAFNSTSPIFKCALADENLRASIFNGICCLAIFMLVSVLLICLNRKTILLVFSLVAAFAGFMLNFVKVTELIMASYAFLALPSVCSTRLALTVLIDIIPTHLRSKAVALAMMCGRIGILAANLLVGYSLNWNCFVTFNAFVLAMLVSFALMSRLPKDARTAVSK
ncbi:synaptic vesicle glycoprotein 2C isoform X2 [Drosophila grimshawi]|uniref:synaptic vesicle glycoprotein 2C isoform X2 n=1 Tax=Drosophila grimshawi TaxID=7222 RepID=UPI0013EEFF32|nr:synaptic vesicle glycoprotein 2C isoform X2 [Drosophila grimshawi]